jgi:predicted DNA-binding antitoxin AbrB/MazE fold protein
MIFFRSAYPHHLRAVVQAELVEDLWPLVRLHRRPIGRSVASMTHTIEAIYTRGVLQPTVELPLRDNQRVRLTVETIDEISKDREAAVSRLKSGIASMRFFSEGALLSREELHHPR